MEFCCFTALKIPLDILKLSEHKLWPSNMLWEQLCLNSFWNLTSKIMLSFMIDYLFELFLSTDWVLFIEPSKSCPLFYHFDLAASHLSCLDRLGSKPVGVSYKMTMFDIFFSSMKTKQWSHHPHGQNAPMCHSFILCSWDEMHAFALKVGSRGLRKSFLLRFSSR